MSSNNKEIVEQIKKLSSAISAHKNRMGSTSNSTNSAKPSKFISKNKSLVVQNDSSFISQGNKLTRVGLVTADRTELEPPKKKIKNIRHSKNISLIQKDGKSFTKKGNTLVSSDMKYKKVVIKGLEFKFKNKKLVRLNANQGGQTPKSIIANGKKFKRSKKGNLIYVKDVQTLSKRQRQNKTLNPTRRVCRFFRFGKCNKLNCKFRHDPLYISPCPHYLLGKCEDTKCPLSHTLNEFNTPLCIFFQKGKCVKPNCKFVHIKYGKNEHVCCAFADNGYCAKGSKCLEKHVFLCPRFNRDGKCTLKSCKLKHQEISRVVQSGGPKEEELLIEEGMIPMIPQFDQEEDVDDGDIYADEDMEEEDIIYIESDDKESDEEEEDVSEESFSSDSDF